MFVRYLPLLLIAIAWQIASSLQLVSTLALPPLSRRRDRVVGPAQERRAVTNGAASLWRAGAGLFLSIVIGATLGICDGVVAAGADRARARWSRRFIRCRNRR